MGARASRPAPPIIRLHRRRCISLLTQFVVALCVVLALLTVWLWLPFVGAAPMGWTRVNVLVLAGTGLLAVVAYVHAAISFSVRDALLSAVLVFGLAWGAEAASLRWGDAVGFGYAYHPELQPRLPGSVPLFIVLAWCVLARVPLVLLRAMPVTIADGHVQLRRVLAKSLCCATALAVWDVVLDPLAVSARLWTWQSNGLFYGVPLLSFVFWFTMGMAVYVPYFALSGLRLEHSPESRAGSGLSCAAVMVGVAPLLAMAVTTRVRSNAPWIIWLTCMAP